MTQTPLQQEEAAVPKNSVALDALADLFESLHRRGIRYCVWKSNIRLEQALRGKTDLDLLVDRKQSETFRQILAKHNVKLVISAPGRQYPGMENYLGFDDASGDLFHLHVHYQLVLGEQHVKNYHLPFEPFLLDSVQIRHGVKIPAPEMELIVLAIRALLKYRDRDAIKDVLRHPSPGLPAHIVAEVKYLLEQTSFDRVAETLLPLAGLLPAEVVLEFLTTLDEAYKGGFRLYRLRKRLRGQLRVYQRHNRIQATLTYFRQACCRQVPFIKLWRHRKMTLGTGGITLALVGVDGSGKTTMSRHLASWLSWRIAVRTYYLGSKARSSRSKLARLAYKSGRRCHRIVCDLLGEDSVFSRGTGWLRNVCLYIYHYCLGLDRYRRYAAGTKAARAGSIVIFDRYPLESIYGRLQHRAMDGPRIDLSKREKAAAVRAAFSRLERNLYHKIRPPDYVITLDVTPDVSSRRRPDHRRAAIDERIRAVDELRAVAESNPDAARLIRVCADLPFREVARQLKAKFWEIL